MIETVPVTTGSDTHTHSRRRFLRQAGGLAALTALTGTGVLSWRTATQGALSPATGPAYVAWGQFHDRGGQPLDLVRAAVLAASAHNTQPWRFRLATGRIDLYAVPDRTTGTMDQLRRGELNPSLPPPARRTSPGGSSTTAAASPSTWYGQRYSRRARTTPSPGGSGSLPAGSTCTRCRTAPPERWTSCGGRCTSRWAARWRT